MVDLILFVKVIASAVSLLVVGSGNTKGFSGLKPHLITEGCCLP